MGLDVLEELGQPFVALHPELFRITGSINAALLLRYLLYRQSPAPSWFPISRTEISEATCLSREQQFTAQTALEVAGFIEAKATHKTQIAVRTVGKKITAAIKNPKFSPPASGCRKVKKVANSTVQHTALVGISHKQKEDDKALNTCGNFPYSLWEFPIRLVGISHKACGNFPHSNKEVKEVRVYVDPKAPLETDQIAGVEEIPPPPPLEIEAVSIQTASQDPSPKLEAVSQSATGLLFPLPVASTSTKQKVTYTEAFLRWFAVYPRRDGKSDGQKAFDGAIKSLSKSMPAEQAVDLLIAGAKAYAKLRAGDDPKFIALPGTWLRGERWNDEGAKPLTLSDKIKVAANGG